MDTRIGIELREFTRRSRNNIQMGIEKDNEMFMELERLYIWINDSWDRIDKGDILTEIKRRQQRFV